MWSSITSEVILQKKLRLHIVSFHINSYQNQFIRTDGRKELAFLKTLKNVELLELKAICKKNKDKNTVCPETCFFAITI